MTTLQLISLYSMALIYCLAGINHFLQPKFYIKITPTWVPNPEKVNLLVGLIEIVFGIGLLFTLSRPYAAIGIMALLIAVFPANVHHFLLVKQKGKNSLITLIRLPLQIVLIYWAYSFI